MVIWAVVQTKYHMPIPQNIREIASTIDANVSQNDRIALADYLATIESDNELYLRCVRKAVKAVERYHNNDIVWLRRWVPIIFRCEEKAHQTSN